MKNPVSDFAACQGGAFTTAQAVTCGWSPHAVAAAVRAKRWRRLGKGVFVELPLWDAMDRRARHLCELHARLLVLDPSWVAARRTAAIAHGLPLLGAVPPRPQLLRAVHEGVGASSDRHGRVATLPRVQIVRAPGPARTSMARTVADLAREEDFRSAVVVADAALNQGLAPEELVAVLGGCEGWPGMARAAHALAFADGRAESVLESISRVGFHQCGVPIPDIQVEIRVHGRLVARVDGLWRAFNLVGEADGAGKYGDSLDLVDEKRRQDELAELGFEVVRWGWDEAWRPHGQLDDKVRRAMQRGGARSIDPRVQIVATTLQDAWRRREHSRPRAA